MIAYPAYTGNIQKARRSDAKNALLDLAGREEKYYSLYNQYTDNAGLLYGDSNTFPLNVQSSDTSYYRVNVTDVVAASAAIPAQFTATATPTGSQSTDACGIFSITSQGVTSVSGNANNCW